MRTVRASEIGTYLFCQRAWSYQRQGAPNDNQVEMAAGSDIHARHGQSVFTAGCLRILAYLLLLAGLAAAVISLLQGVL